MAHDSSVASSTGFDANGFLHLSGRVATPGVRKYSFPGGKTERWLTEEDVLFSEQSMESSKRSVLTFEHPMTGVNPSNVKQYQVGDTSDNVRRSEDNWLIIDCVVRDQAAIDKIVNEKIVGLSQSYRYTLDRTPGVHEKYGPFDARVTSRLSNHIAVSSAPRVEGAEFLFDSEDSVMLTSVEDEPTEAVESEPVAQPEVAPVSVPEPEAPPAEAPVEPEPEAAASDLVSMNFSKDEWSKIKELTGLQQLTPSGLIAFLSSHLAQDSLSREDMLRLSIERSKLLLIADSVGVLIEDTMFNEEAKFAIASRLRKDLKPGVSEDYCQAIIDGHLAQDSGGVWVGSAASEKQAQVPKDLTRKRIESERLSNSK